MAPRWWLAMIYKMERGHRRGDPLFVRRIHPKEVAQHPRKRPPHEFVEVGFVCATCGRTVIENAQ